MSGQEKGLIFDIRRFSTHDGAGLRTTVFIKGCALRCAWCQNPEGIAPNPQLAYFAGDCILCGLCTKIADGATSIADGKLSLDLQKVRQPELYEVTCPAATLRMDSRYDTAENLVEEVLRDRPFFRHGGGVTLSGGEPFFQAEFTLALLRLFKKAGVHTAVESSLCTAFEKLESALPYIDTLFADYKIADCALHEKATGMDNRQITDNLEKVLSSPYRDRVVVRTPLIPGYTATTENLSAICRRISAWYPKVRYELLNYNPLAKAKYAHMEYAYCFAENKPIYTKAQMQEFYRIARSAGVKHLMMDAL